MATVKNEVNQSASNVKREPEQEVNSPALSEIDLYEDAGDLDLAEAAKDIYLTRLPKFLWRTWADLDDDEEVHIGTVRVEGDLQKPSRMSLLLDKNIAGAQILPMDFRLDISNLESANTYLFTEKDLPGYARRNKPGSRQDAASQPFSQVAPRFQSKDRPGTNGKFDKTQRARKRAIPKKTAIAGKIKMEIQCRPVENAHYRQIMDERARQEFKPRQETMILSGAELSGTNTSMIGQPGTFDTFIKTGNNPREKRVAEKAARMPKNQLLDRLFDCFQEYKYWGLKTLRSRLQQPEVYLKETLEPIADLVRQGTFANTWRLKPGAAYSANFSSDLFDKAQEDQAPVPMTGMDGLSDAGGGGRTDDEDEDMKMEDVVMS